MGKRTRTARTNQRATALGLALILLASVGAALPFAPLVIPELPTIRQAEGAAADPAEPAQGQDLAELQWFTPSLGGSEPVAHPLPSWSAREADAGDVRPGFLQLPYKPPRSMA